MMIAYIDVAAARIVHVLRPWTAVMLLSVAYVVVSTIACRITPKALTPIASVIASLHMVALSFASGALIVVIGGASAAIVCRPVPVSDGRRQVRKCPSWALGLYSRRCATPATCCGKRAPWPASRT